MCGHILKVSSSKEEIQAALLALSKKPHAEKLYKVVPLVASPGWPANTNMGWSGGGGHTFCLQCSLLSRPSHITKYTKEQAKNILKTNQTNKLNNNNNKRNKPARETVCRKNKQQGWTSRTSDIKMTRYRNISCVRKLKDWIKNQRRE